MFNLVDLVQMKTKKSREEVEEILTAAVDVTKENLEQGNDVYWVGLCKFTWKKKAPSKKTAKTWAEHPYLAENEKVRVVPDDEEERVDAKGGVVKLKRELNAEVQLETT